MGLSCPISSGGRTRRGIRGCGGWVWAASSTGDAEPVEDVIGLDRNIVVDACSTDGLEVSSVSSAGPTGERRVLLGRNRGCAVTKDVGPLLDAFSKIMVVEGSVAEKSMSIRTND